MKQYFSIFAALVCCGCVTQQTKETSTETTSSPRLDNPVEVDSKQSSATVKNDPKVTLIIPPKPIEQTKTEKKVKQDKVVKNKSILSNKTVLPPKKTAKTHSGEKSLTRLNEPEITKTIVPETIKTSTKKQEIKTTSLEANKLDLEDIEKTNPENSVNVDSTQIIAPQSNLESSPEIEEIEEIEDQVIEEMPIESNTTVFELENLPLSFGDTWILDRNQDKISNTTRCILSSREKNFNDGYSDSKMSLQLSADTLLIQTNSTIDLSYPDIGLYIDQNKHFPLEKLFGDSSIVIKKDTRNITAQLLDGEKITVKLGFWPTWPKTETPSIDFLLSGFDEAFQSFLDCEKL